MMTKEDQLIEVVTIIGKNVIPASRSDEEKARAYESLLGEFKAFIQDRLEEGEEL